MDFFAHQEAAKRRTGWLLLLFVIAISGIILAVHALVISVTKGAHFSDPRWLLTDAAGAFFIILLGVVITAAGLTSSGPSVAEACGGRRIDPADSGPDERRLLNVVEEMAIASGVPVPPVYVLDKERGINAFAAGSSPRDAAVAVTAGALKRFTRDELQGVIAHEFSHILNGDMRLNLRIASWLGGIMGLAVAGEIIVRALRHVDFDSGDKRDSKRDNTLGVVAAVFVIGVGLYLIGWIGVFFARLIQAAVSRQREYLADASAVQFTRNPEGLAGALNKIAGYSGGSTIRNPQAKMFRHQFFSRGDEPSFLDFLLATHPPLQERIKLIDPNFDPSRVKPEPAPDPSPVREPGEVVDGVLDLTGMTVTPQAASLFTNRVGRPEARNLRQAGRFVAGLPPDVTKAAQDPHGASALVFALLLSDDAKVRTQQLDDLQKTVTPPVAYDLKRLLPQMANVTAAAKLPLVELAINGLRQLNPAEYTRFKEVLGRLIESDGFLDLFEFTLQKMVRRHLDTAFGQGTPPRVRFQRIDSLQTECLVLISCLAHQGHPDDPAGAKKAYRAGLEVLHLEGADTTPLPQSLCKLDALDAALDKLADATFVIKKFVLIACVAVTSADQVLRPEEAELLRAISDTLDCPVPPGGGAD